MGHLIPIRRVLLVTLGVGMARHGRWPKESTFLHNGMDTHGGTRGAAVRQCGGAVHTVALEQLGLKRSSGHIPCNC